MPETATTRDSTARELGLLTGKIDTLLRLREEQTASQEQIRKEVSDRADRAAADFREVIDALRGTNAGLTGLTARVDSLVTELRQIGLIVRDSGNESLVHRVAVLETSVHSIKGMVNADRLAMGEERIRVDAAIVAAVSESKAGRQSIIDDLKTETSGRLVNRHKLFLTVLSGVLALLATLVATLIQWVIARAAGARP